MLVTLVMLVMLVILVILVLLMMVVMLAMLDVSGMTRPGRMVKPAGVVFIVPVGPWPQALFLPSTADDESRAFWIGPIPLDAGVHLRHFSPERRSDCHSFAAFMAELCPALPGAAGGDQRAGPSGQLPLVRHQLGPSLTVSDRRGRGRVPPRLRSSCSSHKRA